MIHLNEHPDLLSPGSVCFLTLLTSQQPLDALDEFVPVTVGVDADLLQLLMTHICQHVQRNLPGNNSKHSVSERNILPHI